MKLQNLLNRVYIHIMSQNVTDIGRTSLIELDIPKEGPPITLKPYTIPLKYCEFLDHEIKQLEEVGNWTSPILVVPKKKEHMDASNITGSSKNGKCKLQLCIDYKKLNSWIQTASQIKADGSLGKVISNLDNIIIFSETW